MARQIRLPLWRAQKRHVTAKGSKQTPGNDTMKKANVYTRFSPRPNAEECTSNEKQLQRCRSYCDKRGYELIGVFSDRAKSGKLLNRPGLSEAIAALKPGMVLVVDTSCRLARDMLVNLTIRHQVAQVGGTIEFADGSPCDTTPEGKLFANILGAFAQYERERFARRTKAGLAKKKASGQWLGKPPVGYRVDKQTKQLVEDEQEQHAIEMAVKLHGTNGFNSDSIAESLTQTIGLFRGRPWSARTVRKILKRSVRSAFGDR